MRKTDIFIADAHIENMEDVTAGKFIRFLDHIKDSTRTLYILGDLFDFWFGENEASHILYRPILDKFKELSDASVEIVYLEGNHDFFMGGFFTDVLRAKVFADDARIDVDGKAFYLTHGDMIDYEDKWHLLWRRFLRSRFMFSLMRMLPKKALLFTAKKLSKKSRNYNTEKKILKKEIFDKLVADNHNKGTHTVIFAHYHTPFIEERARVLCINPGAFLDNGSYARYEAGDFSLQNFTG
jgi:UDP-2,3-diacylglucosamine hydrolase